MGRSPLRIEHRRAISRHVMAGSSCRGDDDLDLNQKVAALSGDQLVRRSHTNGRRSGTAPTLSFKPQRRSRSRRLGALSTDLQGRPVARVCPVAHSRGQPRRWRKCASPREKGHREQGWEASRWLKCASVTTAAGSVKNCSETKRFLESATGTGNRPRQAPRTVRHQRRGH